MNRLKLLIVVIAGGLLFSLSACNDILESVEPATSVSGEIVLTTEAGVTALRSSMYAKMHESFTYRTEYFVAPSAFTDETRNRPGSTRYQALTVAVGTSGTSHIASWGTHYNVIQDANLLIGAIEEGVLPAATLARYRAEALTIRAFAFHNLVKVYGYDPGNFNNGPEANWDAGVVIRTEPTIDVLDADLRPRSSVNDVYAQINADLEAARQLSDNLGTNNSFITRAFIDGLNARVALYAGEWAQAATYAQNAISSFGGTLQNTSATVANMFDEALGNHPEALFKLVVNPDTEGGGFNNNGPGTYTSDGFLAQFPTQFLIDKYDDDDYRLGWYRPCADAQRVPLTQPTNCADVNSGGFSIVKFNGAKGQAVDDLPFMRLSEMYLILAEASYKSGNQGAAVAALETLRNARNAGVVPASAIANTTAFEDFILDERMRELAVEGHRFFDLKRLGRDIRNPNGSIKMFADSYRILPQIGINLRNVNPQLVENPGY